MEYNASASGAIVYWSCGPTNRAQLAGRLASLGLDDYQAPERSDYAALKEALDLYRKARLAVVANRERRDGYDLAVEPRKKRADGFVLLEVHRNEAGNDNHRSPLIGIHADESGLHVDMGYTPDLYQIDSFYREAKRRLTGAAVGQVLVKIATEACGAVALRPSGGIYWMPEVSMQRWDAVATAVEECAAEKDATSVHRVRTIMDEQAVRAVRQAITDEVTQAAQRLAEEVNAGDLGPEALASRKAALIHLHRRVEFYEGQLADTLSTLHHTISQVEQTSVLAALDSLG